MSLEREDADKLSPGLAAVSLGLLGVGPVIVAGTLSASQFGGLVGALAGAEMDGLSGALAGAEMDGLAGALVGLGVPRDQAIKDEAQVKADKDLVVPRHHRADQTNQIAAQREAERGCELLDRAVA